MQDTINKILEELTYLQKDNENPGSYMDDEWYIKCRAKAEAFEEAISIIKNLIEKEQG